MVKLLFWGLERFFPRIDEVVLSFLKKIVRGERGILECRKLDIAQLLVNTLISF